LQLQRALWAQLSIVQPHNCAPIAISLTFLHSAGRRIEKALTLSTHKLPTHQRGGKFLSPAAAGQFTAPSRSPYFLAADPPLSHRRIAISP
jgi:hypothetical protein